MLNSFVLRYTLNTRNHMVIPITLVPTMIFGHDKAAHTLWWTQRNYKVQNLPSCALITKMATKKPTVTFAQFDWTALFSPLLDSQLHSGGSSIRRIKNTEEKGIHHGRVYLPFKITRGGESKQNTAEAASQTLCCCFQPLHETLGELEC